jgi:ABC-type uncharacterized transport system involved in gliding motility auxiliary subunit
MTAQFGGEKIVTDFVPTNNEQALAVRLSGTFKTAYPEGKPKAPEPPPGPDGKPAEKKPEEKSEPGLKDSKGAGSVILFGDTDFIEDQVAVQELQNPFGGQRFVMPANGNLALAQGAVEQMSGDQNLISIRSRASRERQFTVVKEMEAKAERAFQGKIKEFNDSLADTNAKLADLQRAKTDKSQKMIVSPEQQKEIDNLNKKKAETTGQLKQVKKQLRADIDSLENRIKWMNIALMPAIVAAIGIGLALVRHQRRAAR